jgi:hypothetical protein
MKRNTLFNQSLNILLFFALIFSSLAASPGLPAEKKTTQGTGPASGTEPAAATASPVMFVENVGQFESGARFQAQGGSGSLWLAEDGMWVTLLEKDTAVKNDPSKPQPAEAAPLSEAAPRKGVNLKLSFAESNPQPVMQGFNRLETKVSYFKGSDPAQWRADVPVWGGVRYVDLYPGIDLEISSVNGQVLQQLVARAGADTQVVQLKVEGMDAMTLEAGVLRLSTPFGDYRLPLLQVNAVQAEISQPVLLPGGLLRSPFVTPEAVSQVPDVQTLAGSADLLYATYLGGSGSDQASGIAVDGSGAAYVTGYTSSSAFPTTPGVFDRSLGGGYDAFVVKLKPSGIGLLYATYLGGSGGEYGYDIAVDASGAAYVTGNTNSSNFPTTPGVFDRSLGGYSDAFVVKLNPTGSKLVYATYLGGWQEDYGYGIAVDGSGAAYVTGNTQSSDFPTTSGAFDTSYNGGNYYGDAFVAKLNASGSKLLYATYLGGSDNDWSNSIAVDRSGAAYVTGETNSPNFPTTPGAFDRSFNWNWDAFVVKLNATGSKLVYATYLGGRHEDYGKGIALDGSGAAYVTGYTDSSDFPTTPGAFDSSFNDYSDAFVAKLNASGSKMVYATFLGGGLVEGHDIAVDGSGMAYVTGYTYSSGFPVTPDAFDTSNNGEDDAFVAKLNRTGSCLVYATYLGGEDEDRGHDIALDGSGMAYVTGKTNSYDFPTTHGAFDPSFNWNGDAFVVKLNPVGHACLGLVITRLAPDPSTSSSLAFRVTFSEPVTGVGAADFKITKSGITGTPAVTAVTGSVSVYDVMISTGAGSGTLRLDIPVTAVIQDMAGKLLAPLPYTSGPFYTLDRTGPTVSSIELLDPNPNTAARLRYRVTFSENVKGVDATDFVLTASGLSGVSIASVTGSGQVYDVSANSGSGFGALRLDVRDNDTILDALGNRLGGTGTGNGNYTAGPKYTLVRKIITFTSLPLVDGWVLESTESSDVGGSAVANTVLQVGDDAANKQYRSLLYFNTSGLPDNANIVRVTLKILSAGVVGTDPFGTHGSLLADIRQGFLGTASNLQALDFQAEPSAAGIGKFVALSGAPGWYQLTLSAAQYAFINKVGPTQFRLRFQLDDNNDLGVDFVKFYSGEAVAANRPTLVVEYKIP